MGCTVLLGAHVNALLEDFSILTYRNAYQQDASIQVVLVIFNVQLIHILVRFLTARVQRGLHHLMAYVQAVTVVKLIFNNIVV